MHQAHLDAIKLYFFKKGECCDDKQARTIDLTKEQYLTCKLDWCNREVWTLLCQYRTSDEYFEKRKRAQEARPKSQEDVAQNRGGSRPWSETQQLLEYKYGPKKAGTLNTYVVMKYGIRNVDKSGNSAPIPSQKAQKRLEDYKAGAKPDEKSQELDGKVLYSMEHGMAHGRVPIANGAVDKEDVLAVAKSKNGQPTNTATYQSVVEENEQLRESNEQLNETNEILLEENGVNRELILRFYADSEKEPPADLLNRLANIDARRHQGTGSSHIVSHPDDIQSNGNGLDCADGSDEGSEDMHGDGGCDYCDEACSDMDGEDNGGWEDMQN